MEDKKLIRVVFEWDDGSTQTMDGEPADLWLRAINSLVVFAEIRGWGTLDEVSKAWVFKEVSDGL